MAGLMLPFLFLFAFVARAPQVKAVNISLAVSAPPTSSSQIANNFQSFSIEQAFWADYGGKRLTSFE
jgi:hypothetical protein